MSPHGRPFRRVLIANRGEIAVRIARACREAGLESVAVHSEADRDAPHVWAADRAVEIGPAPAPESYLDFEKVLEAARRSEADAVHPGYGFLAENADFAEAVEAAGLVWIGPPPAAIRAMGEKTAARRAMAAAGVPVVPGTEAPVADASAALAAAEAVGWPVLLKAAAGGGGKGMRVVEGPDAMSGAFAAAAREAAGAFGDPAVYVERYLARPRHVEIQVLADSAGATIHLGERECSIQRRHQKILEECPAPGVSADLRERMGAVAVQAARAVGYVGAGTVEFLVADSGEFFFLEMNTRLQVEHPVTEMVTGLDIVRLQLSVAAGEALPLGQEEVDFRGHAVECRIAAEDPAAGFLPATGRVIAFQAPAGPGVRWDGGIEAGSVVSPHYDPLLAKCVAWGETRDAALDRMARALDETEIAGVETNLAFQRALVDHPDVRAGAVHTTWLEGAADEVLESIAARRAADAAVAAAVAAWCRHTARGPAVSANGRSGAAASGRSRWRDGATWIGLS